jgi:hypothetical protein
MLIAFSASSVAELFHASDDSFAALFSAVSLIISIKL